MDIKREPVEERESDQTDEDYCDVSVKCSNSPRTWHGNAIGIKSEFEVKSETKFVIETCGTPNIDENQGLCNATGTIDVHIKNEPQEYEIPLINDKSGILSRARSTEPVATVNLCKMIFYERNFVCGVCYSVFPSSADQKLHILIHKDHANIVYECDVCFKLCLSSSLLEEHRLVHSGNNYCDSGGESRQTIDLGEAPFKCRICDFVSKSAFSLKTHKMTHCIKKPYKCTKCNYLSLTNRGLNKHEMIHSLENPFKCDECDYSSKQRRDLIAHKMNHSGERPFKCDVCSYACTRIYSLKLHKRTHSRMNPYNCEECDFAKLSNKGSNTHKNRKPFKCSKCCYSSSKLNDLKLHRMIHSGESPFRCDKCKYVGPHLDALRKHKVIHSGIKQYKCGRCDYETFHCTSMKRHETTHSSKRPFKCDQCRYASKRPTDLKRHKLTHSGKKMAKCNDFSSKDTPLKTSTVHSKRHLYILNFSESQDCTGQKNSVAASPISTDIYGSDNKIAKSDASTVQKTHGKTLGSVEERTDDVYFKNEAQEDVKYEISLTETNVSYDKSIM